VRLRLAGLRLQWRNRHLFDEPGHDACRSILLARGKCCR
jgi:hypothetical protein